MTAIPRAVSTQDAALYLGMPPATLAYWRSVGSGPRWFKLGRRVRYDIADLDAFVDERMRIGSMRCHRVETVRRGDWTDEGGVTHAGYAARCTECSAITFGGFASRSAARAALRDHEREADK